MDQYSPIRISSLKGNLSIPFDVYVRVDNRYILYCRSSEAIEGARLDRLRSKRATHVYIASNEIHTYMNYITEKINEAYDMSADMTLKARTGLILGALQTITQDLIENLDDAAKYKVVIQGVLRFAKFMDQNPTALLHFLNHKNEEHNITHHGVHVAALSYELAKGLGYVENMPMQIPYMLVGCLIHDLEHHYNNVNVKIPADKLGDAEKRIYNLHAIHAKARIKKFEFYDILVREIIAGHDTRIEQEPVTTNNHTKKTANPLVAVAATANVYDYYVNKFNISPKEALKKMLIEEVGALPLECLKGLQDVLKKREVI